ncbi:hypothetical protein HYW76_05355 [Candidatus Pacearchaeota archaeon]|nr:hypothetical protein [Candidatus Pacearchaeota archaeon]
MPAISLLDLLSNPNNPDSNPAGRKFVHGQEFDLYFVCISFNHQTANLEAYCLKSGESTGSQRIVSSEQAGEYFLLKDPEFPSLRELVHPNNPLLSLSEAFA